MTFSWRLSLKKHGLVCLSLLLILFGCAGQKKLVSGDGKSVDRVSETRVYGDEKGQSIEWLDKTRQAIDTAAFETGLGMRLLPKGQLIKMDAKLDDWPQFFDISSPISGQTNAKAKVAIAYDDNDIYIAAEYIDKTPFRSPTFSSAEDHLEWFVAFPDGKNFVYYTIMFFPGQSGVYSGKIRLHSQTVDRDLSGIRIVEKSLDEGDTMRFEAQIPWHSFPEAKKIRVGLRGGFIYVDGAHGRVGTVRDGSYGWPMQLTESELSLFDFLEARGIPKQKQIPTFDLFVDVTGDGIKERVSVFDRILTLCGSAFRGGVEFFYRDLGADLLSIEPVASAVGTVGKSDLALRERIVLDSDSELERFEVWSLVGDSFTPFFMADLVLKTHGGVLVNNVKYLPKKIVVSLDPMSEKSTLGEESYPHSSGVEVMIGPWNLEKSRTYLFNGSRFVLDKTENDKSAPK